MGYDYLRNKNKFSKVKDFLYNYNCVIRNILEKLLNTVVSQLIEDDSLEPLVNLIVELLCRMIKLKDEDYIK